MKAPPKRKGNLSIHLRLRFYTSLNESPSEKEGKCVLTFMIVLLVAASMKAPPKRKGNFLCLPPPAL